MAEQGLRYSKETKDRKLGRAMIAHVLKAHRSIINQEVTKKEVDLPGIWRCGMLMKINRLIGGVIISRAEPITDIGYNV